MIDEKDNGAALVAAVGQRIAARYGDRVVVDYPPVVGAHLSAVRFLPRREGAADICVTGYYDWSFQVDVADVTVMEDEGFVPPESEHVARIVSIVEEIATHGFVKIRTMRFLGALSPTKYGAPRGPERLEEVSSPYTRVVREWLPW